jgi:hypothetical protein
MLVLLVALVVLMPVSYRAGTTASHPHTIFQGLIDMVVGQPHQHGDDHHHDSPHGDASRSGIERSPGGLGHRAAERSESRLASPDMPSWLGLSSPIDGTAAIHALGVLVAVILSGSAGRSLWDAVRAFSGLSLKLDPPPPRFT